MLNINSFLLVQPLNVFIFSSLNSRRQKARAHLFLPPLLSIPFHNCGAPVGEISTPAKFLQAIVMICWPTSGTSDS